MQLAMWNIRRIHTVIRTPLHRNNLIGLGSTHQHAQQALCLPPVDGLALGALLIIAALPNLEVWG